RRTAAAPPSRRSRAPRRRRRRRRRSTSRAGRAAAATRAAVRRRCPAPGPASPRVRRGEAVFPKWGDLPMYGPTLPGTILARRVAHVDPSETLNCNGGVMAASQTHGGDPIKVGVITDQTGPLSVIGLANANVDSLVSGELNTQRAVL